MEFKIEITGNEFKLVTMMFVDDRDFTTLGKRNDSMWDKVHQQHQSKVHDWSGGLCCSRAHI